MTKTVLDTVHAIMTADPENDAARLRFYERLGDAELFLLLEGNVEADKITPQIFDPGTGSIVLVFDRVERLTQFVGAEAPYASLSGRIIARLLSEKDLGLGLNLDVAPSAFLLDAEGIRWLAKTLEHSPDEVEMQFAELLAPKGLPDALISAIDAKLAMATGLAQTAFLVGTTDADSQRGHMLAFVGAAPRAEAVLARAASEALTFSGIEAGAMDVGFFDAKDPMMERFERVGLRFDLPQPAPVSSPEIITPGSNPAKPPILR